MEESTIWIIAVVAVFGGALIGYLIGRTGGGSQRQTELVDQLDETKRELETYKQNVTTHFEETARLVGDLTESYKNVHQHLAKSSVTLCGADTVTEMLATAIQPSLPAENTDEVVALEDATQTEVAPSADIEQPRDYAPKASDQEGTLSETFGLKEKDDAPEEPVVADAVEAPKRRSVDQD